MMTRIKQKYIQSRGFTLLCLVLSVSIISLIVASTPGMTRFIQQTVPPASITEADTIQVLPISGEAGWGYEVYVNRKLFIRQPTLPAVAGNRGFSSREKAEKTGLWVADKIRRSVMSPSISLAELDSLRVVD